MLELKDILTLVFQRTDAMQIHWNVFIVVSLGVVGFIASNSFAPDRRKLIKIITIFAFVIFAASNFGEFNKVRAERRELVSLLRINAKTDPSITTLAETVQPSSDSRFNLFYSGIAAIVVVCIICLSPEKKDEATTLEQYLAEMLRLRASIDAEQEEIERLKAENREFKAETRAMLSTLKATGPKDEPQE